MAAPSSGTGLRPFDYWECEFESRRVMDIFLLWLLCVVRRRTDHSSRGVVPNVVSECDRKVSIEKTMKRIWAEATWKRESERENEREWMSERTVYRSPTLGLSSTAHGVTCQKTIPIESAVVKLNPTQNWIIYIVKRNCYTITFLFLVVFILKTLKQNHLPEMRGLQRK